jgi:ABC-type transporter Mla subunit MlaD
MKYSMHYIMISLIVIFLIAGCSRQPLQEINAAKAAVDFVISEGAEKYLPDDAKKLNDNLNKAMDEVKAQDAKILKNYSKAKEMLVNVKAEAEDVNSKLPAKKEEAKKDAIAAIEAAKAAMDETKALLTKGPSGKGPGAANETISADIKNLEDSLEELQVQIDREDYMTIASKAGEIRNKASELSTLLKQTPAKTEKNKK